MVRGHPTEMANRTRSLTSAALSSSVWLVCKKRRHCAPRLRPTSSRICARRSTRACGLLGRRYPRAGLRLAATGPAMEAYSQHPVVKKANEPGQVMTVSEFSATSGACRRFRRRPRADQGRRRRSGQRPGRRDHVYLLHRNDFGLDKAPSARASCTRSPATSRP